MGRKVLAFVLLAGLALTTTHSLSAGVAKTGRDPKRMPPRPDVREIQGRRMIMAIVDVVDAPSWVKLHSRADTLYAPPGPEGSWEVTLPFDVASNGLLNQSGELVLSVKPILTPDCREVGWKKPPLEVALPIEGEKVALAIGRAGEVVVSVGSVFGPDRIVIERKRVSLTRVPLPWETTLLQNFPNPFSEKTELGFYLASPGRVSVRVYDRAGRLVTTLLDADEKPGYYPFIWDGCDRYGRKVAAGVYFYRLVTEGHAITKKLVLLR